MRKALTPAQERNLEHSIENKVIIVREGSRGWGLGECFIEDACGILSIEKPELPDREEDREDYSEAVEDFVREFEGKIGEKGFTVIWNDGYVVYENLNSKELEFMENWG